MRQHVGRERLPDDGHRKNFQREFCEKLMHESVPKLSGLKWTPAEDR
jgi:hypothetical protein